MLSHTIVGSHQVRGSELGLPVYADQSVPRELRSKSSKKTVDQVSSSVTTSALSLSCAWTVNVATLFPSAVMGWLWLC
ncbi:hypothetical protein FM113_09215 [Leucobacter sp. 7(1)]|nr:hypothetical protein FM113_09215 [Leucobacter sp. 7(1)]